MFISKNMRCSLQYLKTFVGRKFGLDLIGWEMIGWDLIRVGFDSSWIWSGGIWFGWELCGLDLIGWDLIRVGFDSGWIWSGGIWFGLDLIGWEMIGWDLIRVGNDRVGIVRGLELNGSRYSVHMYTFKCLNAYWIGVSKFYEKL